MKVSVFYVIQNLNSAGKQLKKWTNKVFTGKINH